MQIKKGIGFIHLWIGLLSGLVVFIVSITGCIYAFEEELRALVHKDLYTVNVSSTPAKSITEIVQTVKKEFPKQKIRSIKIKNTENSSIQVNLKNRKSVYINPYTAEILGTIDQEKDFFSIVLKIHRELYLGKAGKNITGISCLLFTFIIITGIVIWWPTKKRALKQKLSIMKKAKWKRLNYDLHSILGFYASWILIFVALTGLVWSFKWAENSMFWLSGSKNEKRKEIKSLIIEKRSSSLIENAIKQSGQLYTESKERIIFMPEDSVGALRINFRFNNSGLYTKQSQLFFDQYSGRMLKVNLFEYASTGEKLKATNYNIHTGKVLNLPGQILVFCASLICASLPITGFMIWLNKRRKTKTAIK